MKPLALAIYLTLAGCATRPAEPPNPFEGMAGVERLTDAELWRLYNLRQAILWQSAY